MSVSPQKLTLDFSEQLEPDLIGLRLYDWNARQIDLPAVKLTPGKPDEMYVNPPNLPDGTYTVVWNVVSQDGHPVSGSYVFSVGSVKFGKTISINDAGNSRQTAMIFVRYLVEGLILLLTGFSWFARLANLRGFPLAEQLLGRQFRLISVFALIIGSILEWFNYSASLPGSGLTLPLLEGKFYLIRQSPFAELVLVQLVLLLLLLIPDMVETWYLFILTLLCAVLALGGHVWGIDPFWMALVVRIVHLLSISAWMGALTYLVLFLRWDKKQTHPMDKSQFRRFFTRFAGVSAVLVAFSGIDLVTLQTDWFIILHSIKLWTSLLFVKIAIFCLMLLLALTQTLRWRKTGQSISSSLLGLEWTAGVLAILVGVWMSQSAYPLPLKSYSKTMQAHNHQIDVHISQLSAGVQHMDVRLLNPKDQEPAKVNAQVTAIDMDMGVQNYPLQKQPNGDYAANLVFSMAGKWQFTVDFEYSDGSHETWSDQVIIPQEGE